jgi:hypothetical protein
MLTQIVNTKCIWLNPQICFTHLMDFLGIMLGPLVIGRQSMIAQAIK